MPDWYTPQVEKALVATGRDKFYCGDEGQATKVFLDWLEANSRSVRVDYACYRATPYEVYVHLPDCIVIPAHQMVRIEALASAVLAVAKERGDV